jgi:hypothetical protein
MPDKEMKAEGYKYKNPKIERVKGGYIVCYDLYKPSHNEYDSMYMSREKEVFENGSEALKRLDEVFEDSM